MVLATEKFNLTKSNNTTFRVLCATTQQQGAITSNEMTHSSMTERLLRIEWNVSADSLVLMLKKL